MLSPLESSKLRLFLSSWEDADKKYGGHPFSIPAPAMRVSAAFILIEALSLGSPAFALHQVSEGLRHDRCMGQGRLRTNTPLHCTNALVARRAGEPASHAGCRGRQTVQLLTPWLNGSFTCIRVHLRPFSVLTAKCMVLPLRLMPAPTRSCP